MPENDIILKTRVTVEELVDKDSPSNSHSSFMTARLERKQNVLLVYGNDRLPAALIWNYLVNKYPKLVGETSYMFVNSEPLPQIPYSESSIFILSLPHREFLEVPSNYYIIDINRLEVVRV